MEKEIIYHPDQLIKDVDKRWDDLGYGYYTDQRIINNPNQPSRIETRLQIQALCLDLKDLLVKKGNVSLSDEDIEKTWIKEGPIAFLSSLYYWLHTSDTPTEEEGVDDAWYQVSTHLSAFRKSVDTLFKHKERENDN